MAGKKQHIIPRFLLKGFASKVIPKKVNKQDKVFVWVYRKDGKTYESNTEHVGAEEWFYTNSEPELTVDDEITSIEPRFAYALDQLRNQIDGTEVTDKVAIEFVVNLAARTKHVRDFMIDSGGFLVDKLLGYFSDYRNIREYFIRTLTRHPEILMDQFEKSLNEIQASSEEKDLAREFVRQLPAEVIVGLMDKDAPELEGMFEALRTQFAFELNDTVKQAHIKFLLKNLISEPRVARYQAMQWYVRRSNEPLILGDACCLFELKDSTFKSIGGAEETVRIYLPVSSDCVLVGTTAADIPTPDITLLNETSATLSKHYYVSSVKTHEIERLSNRIGQSEWLTRDEMEEIVTDVIYSS